MFTPEFRRSAVVRAAATSIAEAAAEAGVSESSLRRWVRRADLSDRPRSGRPQIQSTATQVVEALVGTAGARISGKDYSTRALAEATGLSQSIVSRAVREMTVPLSELHAIREDGAGGDEVVVAASGFPLIVVGFRLGSGDPDRSPVPARRIQRRIAGLVAGLRSAGVTRWPQRFGSEHRQTDDVAMGILLDGVAGIDPARLRLVVYDPLGEAAELVADPDAGLPGFDVLSLHHGPEDFIAALKTGLAHCQDIPGSLLDLVAGRVRHGLEGVSWRAGHQTDLPKTSTSSDSMEISSWLPSATRSITEHLAIALREEIIDSGYQPGDRINPRLLSRRMDVPRSSVDAALRRMVDDGLLDGSRGGARIPLITTLDVLDLYAARMAVGEVVLRSLALRPQRFLVPVQLALRQVEASAATRSGIDVEDADLHYQQELARASGLRQSARAFESLTLRLRLFISVLRLDYSPAADRILGDDRGMYRALSRGDAETAIDVWRGKVDNAVRHMSGLLARRRFDQELWDQLTRSLR